MRSAGGTGAHVVGYELDQLPFTTVDLYKQFWVNLRPAPYIPKIENRLTVKADLSGGQKIHGRHKPYFSTVVIDEQKGRQAGNGIKGEYQVMNLTKDHVLTLCSEAFRCAIVRAIMRIPGPPGEEERVVAFVDWFSRFPTQPHETSQMYRVKKAYQTGGQVRESCAVNIKAIQRPVHLIPEFGRSVPIRWRSWSVLEQVEAFFVNCFIDQDMYQQMH